MFKLWPIFLAAVVVTQAAEPKPDLLFILADDLGYADVGFNGGKDIPTPHLDKLAASGAVLEQFYVQAVCSPTRAALLTGRYPMRYGLQQGVVRPGAEYGLPLEERTLADALREAGYTTAITGKWHLGEVSPSYLPTKRGFDIQYGHFFGALDYDTKLRNGKRDWFRNDQPCDDQGYTTHLICQEAGRIVAAQPKEKPLFLYVPFNAVHSPYHTAPGREKDFASLPKARRSYATMLSEMDTAIGEILAAFEKAGRRDNCLVFFCSDNGGIGPASNGGLRGRKNTPYEGGHRVAACVSFPGRIKAGGRIAEPLHIVDWFPTLAALAGFSISPEKQKKPLDGCDILKTLTEGAKSPHQEILIACESSVAAIRAGDWKLIVHPKNAPKKKRFEDVPEVQLFNLAKDAGEKENLAEREPARVAELQARLAAYQKAAVPPLNGPGDTE